MDPVLIQKTVTKIVGDFALLDSPSQILFQFGEFSVGENFRARLTGVNVLNFFASLLCQDKQVWLPPKYF